MKYFGTITDPKDLVNKEYIDDIADTKANIDGAYENMTVGNAEQLVSTVMVNDQEPYIFRTAGGSADIGDREYDTLVGGTIAWNQLVYNGNFSADTPTANWQASRSSISVTDGVATLTCANNPETIFGLGRTLAAGMYVAGHVYLPIFTFGVGNIASEMTALSFRFNSNTLEKDFAVNSDGRYGTVVKLNVDESMLYIRVKGTFTDSSYFTAQEVCVFDLTKMFGWAIADYVYALETSNAGDGVKWFTKMYNATYYPYTTGELLSVSGVSAHNTTGLNQWDELWRLGTYVDGTGAFYGSGTSNFICNATPIKVLPNTVYYSNVVTRRYYYDINMNFISHSTNSSGTFTTPANCYYMNFRDNSGEQTYSNNICINLHWDGEMDGTYEPYKLNSYPLDSSLTLRGNTVLDVNNALHYEGDTYEANGTVTRNWAVLTNQSGNIGSTITLTGCDTEATDIITSVGHLVDVGTLSGDVLTLTVALSGADICYPLATPVIETADSFQSPQVVNDYGTEEYVTTAQSGVLVLVGHNTNYANNLRAKLEMAPDSPNGDGDYIVRQSGGINAYVPLVFPVDELPVAPSEDGSYTLQVTISGGTATYSWVSA